MEDVTDHNEGGKEEPDPKSLVGQKMFVKALLRFDNIYVSGAVSAFKLKLKKSTFVKLNPKLGKGKGS